MAECSQSHIDDSLGGAAWVCLTMQLVHSMVFQWRIFWGRACEDRRSTAGQLQGQLRVQHSLGVMMTLEFLFLLKPQRNAPLLMAGRATRRAAQMLARGGSRCARCFCWRILFRPYPLFCNGARGRWRASPVVVRLAWGCVHWRARQRAASKLEAPQPFSSVITSFQQQRCHPVLRPPHPSRYCISILFNPHFSRSLIDQICMLLALPSFSPIA